jgi:hypothetical protein
MSDDDVRDGLRDGFGDELTEALNLRSQRDDSTETVVGVQRHADRQRARRRVLAGAVAVAAVAAAVIVVSIDRGGHGVRTITPSNTTTEAPSATSSSSSTSTTTAVAPPAPKNVVVTAGAVGPLRFGVATAAAVRTHMGVPAANVRGSFGMAATPDYQALGYDCSSTKGAHGIRIGPYGVDAPPYCRTVYYINVDTHTLAGFETTASGYSTANGTTFGMTEAAAAGREGQPSTQGCFTGILIGRRAAGGSPKVFVFVGTHPTDRVSAITADNPGNSVGVLFC